jgi:hypothetical protein
MRSVKVAAVSWNANQWQVDRGPDQQLRASAHGQAHATSGLPPASVSALGHKLKSLSLNGMSVLPPGADIASWVGDVRKVPNPEVKQA